MHDRGLVHHFVRELHTGHLNSFLCALNADKSLHDPDVNHIVDEYFQYFDRSLSTLNGGNLVFSCNEHVEYHVHGLLLLIFKCLLHSLGTWNLP